MAFTIPISSKYDSPQHPSCVCECVHTTEVEEVGQSVGQHRPLAARHAVPQQLLRVSAERLASLRPTHPDVDARLTAAQQRRVQAWNVHQDAQFIKCHCSSPQRACELNM